MDNVTRKYIPSNLLTKEYGNLIEFKIPEESLIDVCKNLYFNHQLPLKIITAFDQRKESDCFKIMYVFAVPLENIFIVPYVLVKNSFPSITRAIHEASTYERKIMTFFGLNPQGHPNLRTLILHENWPDNVFPLRKDFPWNERPEKASGKFEFRKITGEGIYEIPVGPVHAGIIEPGHFRFSVLGEEILWLEPRLGYSHKGSEKLFETLSLEKSLEMSERISGDSSFNHSLAFCQAIENSSDMKVLEKSKYLRVVFAELERLANHFGDIGAIMLDTGFNFGGANGARLREMVMQINERITGSRFLRGVNIFGGVSKDISQSETISLVNELDKICKDFSDVISVAKNSRSLFDRLKETGVLDYQIAKDHGVIGVAARAIGFNVDARIDYPYAAYDKINFQIANEKTGDVFARFYVRVKEVYASIEIIKTALKYISSSQENILDIDQKNSLKKNYYSISITEGWRGDIVYFISTDANGCIDRVDLRDPSFLNWTALGYAGRGNMVPDFPLINKSFSLSYSGNDL